MKKIAFCLCSLMLFFSNFNSNIFAFEGDDLSCEMSTFYQKESQIFLIQGYFNPDDHSQVIGMAWIFSLLIKNLDALGYERMIEYQPEVIDQVIMFYYERFAGESMDWFTNINVISGGEEFSIDVFQNCERSAQRVMLHVMESHIKVQRELASLKK